MRDRAVRSLRASVRSPWAWGLAAVMALGLVLRLWGIQYGLPFAYNIDERAHFVPRAVEMFGGSLDPDYQLNPAGYTYAAAAGMALVYRSAETVQSTFADDPTAIFTVARVVSALLGTAAIGLLYLAGRRLFGRGAGLLAAALMALTFLPVFYGHFALNDAPSLLPIALSLVGVAGILRGGGPLDYLWAGLGAGMAGATKYNAGFVAIALAVATLAHLWRVRALRPVAIGAVAGGIGVVAGFLVLNPFALLNHTVFLDDLERLRDHYDLGRMIGEVNTSGEGYFLWSLTWGLGWVPLALAAIGTVRTGRREPWALAALIAVPVFSIVYLGAADRYFARYILPAYPMLMLLAGAGGAALVDLAGRRSPSLRWVAATVVAAAALGQGLVTTVHNDVVLARQDTRSTARAWMVDNIPAGTKVVVEPSVPREWHRDGGLPWGDFEGTQFYRWDRFRRSKALKRELSKAFPGAAKSSDFQNYQFTLFPGMLDTYRELGFCWVFSTSMQQGRSARDPDRAPEAIQYYRALASEADVAYRISPVAADVALPAFQFDHTFNYYPLAFRRPGPEVTVYRLRGGACGSERSNQDDNDESSEDAEGDRTPLTAVPRPRG
ncbi:MAG: glycosyltransferase family 39 protein [Solirubrobacterales bacterium]